MTRSTRLIILGISTFLALPPGTATSNEVELAGPAELARLAESQHEFQTKIDAQLHSRVDALIEAKVGRVLADRTTQLLRKQARHTARQDLEVPAAMQSAGHDPSLGGSGARSNTTCAMVGNTFECVLQDVASR